jgi:hypothetical protein
MTITFSSRDVNLTSFLHTDAMVVTVHIDRWDITKILIDNDSQAEEEQTKLLSFLDKNSNVFAWSTFDSVGVSRDVIEHRQQVNPSARLKKQKLHKMAEEKVKAAKAEVQRLLDTCFIREVKYPQWLANIVMVRKKNGKW